MNLQSGILLISIKKIELALKSTFLCAEATLFSTGRTANPVNRSCATVVHRYVFINFSLKKLLSADAVVTGTAIITLS
jgi:hypothetical protein